MSLVLSGPVTGVVEREGVSAKTGKPWHLRDAVVLNGMTTVRVRLTKDVPTPGEGELVSYEVGVSARASEDGRIWIDYTAFKALEVAVAGARVL